MMVEVVVIGDDDQRHICGGLLRLVDNLTQKPETM